MERNVCVELAARTARLANCELVCLRTRSTCLLSANCRQTGGPMGKVKGITLKQTGVDASLLLAQGFGKQRAA